MEGVCGKLTKLLMVIAVFSLLADGALAKDPERPFRGRGEATAVGPCELDGIPGSQVEGWIIATHVGLSRVSHCGIVTGGMFPILGVAGAGTATAANGDEAYYSYAGTVDLTTCVVTSIFTVDGGTGRFEGASGLIDAVTVQPSPAPFTCGPEQASTLNGTITY
jgi:hypothetical protein